MAQVPKLTASPAVQSAAATRPAPGSRVASISTSSADQPNAITGTQLDAAPFGFENSQPELNNREDGRRQGQDRRQHLGVLNAPSQAFAELLEYEAPTTASAGAGASNRERAFAGLVSKAIATYETTAKIIHGDSLVLGTEVSVTL